MTCLFDNIFDPDTDSDPDPENQLRLHCLKEFEALTNPSADYYSLIDHTADLGIRVVGPDSKTLFENAAAALFELLADSENVTEQLCLGLEISGHDYAELMFNWLRELLYLRHGKNLIGKRVMISSLTETGLCARVWAETHDPERHRIDHEIKAVTYHQLTVEEKAEGWTAQIIFDV